MLCIGRGVDDETYDKRTVYPRKSAYYDLLRTRTRTRDVTAASSGLPVALTFL